MTKRKIFKTKEIHYSTTRKKYLVPMAIFIATIGCLLCGTVIAESFSGSILEENTQATNDTDGFEESISNREKQAEDDLKNQNKDSVPELIEQPDSLGSFIVNRVIDGDTIEIIIDNQPLRVRLIGVNTPESVHPSKPQECFGVKASNYLKKKLSGQIVALEYDQTQDRYDTYGRLLAYVYHNGRMVNYDIIYDGYGYEYTFNIPYRYQKEFKKAQQYASANNKGLWSPSECNGY